jgi:hypothetical protein
MPGRGNPIEQGYITVAERIEKFYERFAEGRIITHIVEHDAERGFVLIRAEVFRNPDDAIPAATGHAYELKTEGYVQRTSYVEVGETSAVGRALAMAGFEVMRGIASQEEMDKAARHEKFQKSMASDDQKHRILDLLETARPGDRRAQRTLLHELSGKESRDDLTHDEAVNLIKRLKESNETK